MALVPVWGYRRSDKRKYSCLTHSFVWVAQLERAPLHRAGDLCRRPGALPTDRYCECQIFTTWLVCLCTKMLVFLFGEINKNLTGNRTLDLYLYRPTFFHIQVPEQLKTSLLRCLCQNPPLQLNGFGANVLFRLITRIILYWFSLLDFKISKYYSSDDEICFKLIMLIRGIISI